MELMRYTKPITVQGQPLPQLYAKEYEDPRDSFYLDALKLNKGFDQAAKLAIEYSIERFERIQYTGSNVRVTPQNMPYLYNCVEQACRILNVDTIPEIYVNTLPTFNAFTTGAANPILVLHNSILGKLTHEELMFIIGHEIGHIKSEHLQYTLVGATLVNVSHNLIDTTLLGSLITSGLNLAFYEWERRAEFTADHAGLLVCQDLKSAISALAKMGGYPSEFYDTLDPNDFLMQAQAFTDFSDSLYNKFIKTFLIMDADHPWTVLRARELMLWVQSGEYSRIMHRSSTWLRDEIERLTHAADMAEDHHARSQADVQSAHDNVLASQADARAARVETHAKTGFDLFWAKSHEGLKALQVLISEQDKKRKLEAAEDAQQDLQAAEEKEAAMRRLYRPVSEELILAHTNETIGQLTRISEDPSAK